MQDQSSCAGRDRPVAARPGRPAPGDVGPERQQVRGREHVVGHHRPACLVAAATGGLVVNDLGCRLLPSAPRREDPPVARSPAQLTDSDLAFLAERHLATLTTLRADGSPHVCAVGFSYAHGVARVIIGSVRCSMEPKKSPSISTSLKYLRS